MDGKKFSFGFSKIEKKPNLLASKHQLNKDLPKVELIKCLEGNEIKLVEEQKVAAPLVIPLANSDKTSAALLSLMKRRAILLGEELPALASGGDDVAEKAQTNGRAETLEQRAARELLAETDPNGHQAAENDKLVLPVVKPDDLPLDGAKESTIDDYDSVPIQQFGLAMLRGMGWVDPPPSTKKKGDGPSPIDEGPVMRPKGMGLGADKALKAKTLLVQPEANEVLEIKRQAYVRILGGKHSGLYGQIEGFDDHAGRVIVRMAIGGNKEAFNEFLCQPVSRKEHAEYGKCINTAKYEAYKRQENEYGQIPTNAQKVDRKVKKEEADGDMKRRIKQENTGVQMKTEQKYEQRDNKERERTRRHDEERSELKHRGDADRRPDKHSTTRRDREPDRRERRSRSHERRRDDGDVKAAAPTSSSSRHRHAEHARAAPATLGTASSGSDSDSDDSAYDRRQRHKKSSDANSSSRPATSRKHKTKKAKSKSKQRQCDFHNISESSYSDSSSPEAQERRHKSQQKKKKTKKSKKQRSRSRSRGRR